MKSKTVSMRRILIVAMILVMALGTVPGFAAAPTEAFDYDGENVKVLKWDADATEPADMGMLSPREGTTCALDGDNVVIHYIPNKTTYVGIHMGLITDEEKTTDYELTDGAYDITLPKSYCGKAHPIAPLKADGGTTTAQCYLAIPSEAVLNGGSGSGDEPGGDEPGGDDPQVTNEVNSGEIVELAPGTYEAIDPEAITAGNKMFRGIKANLVVNDDGSAVLDIYLSGTGYNALYNGERMVNMPNGAITQTNENKLWTSEDLPLSEAVMFQEGEVDGEMKYHFELSFDKLYSWILIGGHSGNFDQWSHKTLNFSADNFRLVEEGDDPGTSAPTADFGNDMVVYVIMFIVSLSYLIFVYRERRYE